MLKGVNGCRGHSVVRGLGLKPLWIKRLVRIHRASRPIIAAAPVSLRERPRYGSSEETHTGDDKENRSGKRGRRAPPEAKSPLRLVALSAGSVREHGSASLLTKNQDGKTGNFDA